MKVFVTLMCALFFCFYAIAQDGVNQVIIVNSGYFGNPVDGPNIASFDPVTGNYKVFDSIPGSSVQDIVIEGDYAYVAAQEYILKYELDGMTRVAIADFPGLSAHQLEIYGDKLLATNNYGQTSDNLYIFDKADLSVIDTVQEISYGGGTMAVVGDILYISQNEKGHIDLCAPWGCLNDTLGYLSQVNLLTNQWVKDIPLNNYGSEAGRLVYNGSTITILNEISNTVTLFLPSTEESLTDTLPVGVNIARYRTESEVVAGKVVSLFGNGLGALANDLSGVQAIVDTPAVAFAYDIVNDRYYITATDFFTYQSGYAFDGNGNHLFDFPVGIAPEAIAIQYNNQPVGDNFETASVDSMLIDVNDIATDPDGDVMVASRIIYAPVNGVATIVAEGFVKYISLSPGSADFFRIEVCDKKLNPLCAFINVTILSTVSVADEMFRETGIYPIPAKDFLFVDRPVEGSSYRLFNAVGEVVQRGKVSAQIAVSELPTGNYFLRMEMNGSGRTYPLVKL